MIVGRFTHSAMIDQPGLFQTERINRQGRQERQGNAKNFGTADERR
ncbi:hypothetical protein PLANPX_5041 [Lacipirellula parvula]|uniref:Uncharacterized protein n=1 Tax=Lacipirellula parvula TaxID=2650471 RepID=A0A5K7XPR1_9BACT|nr:hypothetical protein PLANPX_5041 [Lacipirellula parvula]